MNKDQQIYDKINQAIRILCDVYDILNQPKELNIENDKPNFFTIKTFCKTYPSFTEGAVRNWIITNKNNFK